MEYNNRFRTVLPVPDSEYFETQEVKLSREDYLLSVRMANVLFAFGIPCWGFALSMPCVDN